MKTTISIILFTLISITACWSQSDKTSDNVFQDWGKSVNGVQLSIGLTNSIVAAGSTFPVFVKMINGSTNDITFGDSSPEQDFTISLTGNTGKTYQLTPMPMDSSVIEDGMHPGASRRWAFDISINQYYPWPGIISTNADVPSGNYMINATRGFGVGAKGFRLASNNLKMQIK